MRVKRAQLVYMAAVIDTMGNLTTRPTAASHLPLVEVNGPNMALLDWLSGMSRTKPLVIRRAYSKAGCAEHCAEKHQHVKSVSGRWSVSGCKATVILYNVAPFMQLQQVRAEELVEHGLQFPWRSQAIRDMRELGYRFPAGWKAAKAS